MAQEGKQRSAATTPRAGISHRYARGFSVVTSSSRQSEAATLVRASARAEETDKRRLGDRDRRVIRGALALGAMQAGTAYVGAADHAGWAILITVGRDGRFIDRRRVELVEAGLPILPHHHDAQGLPIEEGVALIERVAASAARCAASALEGLARDVPGIVSLSIRACPALPETIAERIRDYRAQNVADTVMFREALAGAARARGWSVTSYEKKTVLAEAAKAMGRASVDDLLEAPRRSLGPPWQQDHRMAMAAAIAASRKAPARGG
jgi:hypothetical protein